MHRMLNQDYLVKVKNMHAHSELKFQSSSLCKKFQFHVPVPCSCSNCPPPQYDIAVTCEKCRDIHLQLINKKQICLEMSMWRGSLKNDIFIFVEGRPCARTFRAVGCEGLNIWNSWFFNFIILLDLYFFNRQFDRHMSINISTYFIPLNENVVFNLTPYLVHTCGSQHSLRKSEVELRVIKT